MLPMSLFNMKQEKIKKKPIKHTTSASSLMLAGDTISTTAKGMKTDAHGKLRASVKTSMFSGS